MDGSSSISLEEFRLYVDNAAKAAEEADPVKKLFIFADTAEPENELSFAEWSKEMRLGNKDLTDE